MLAVFFVSSIVTSYEFLEKEKQDQVIAASPSSHRYADIYGLSDQQSKWWEVQQTNETLFDGLDKYHIYLRFSDIDDGGIHSCYQYQLVLRTTKAIEYVNTFCYPSLVITAYRKSGSSAAYSLISRYPHVVTTYTKENCPYILGVSLVQYFESLPTQVESGELILDGCVDLKGNMKMRAILHEPNTLYLVRSRTVSSVTPIFPLFHIRCSNIPVLSIVSIYVLITIITYYYYYYYLSLSSGDDSKLRRLDLVCLQLLVPASL